MTLPLLVGSHYQHHVEIYVWNLCNCMHSSSSFCDIPVFTHVCTHICMHTLQMLSADDPLGVLLNDLPAPNEDNLKNNAVVKLDLIQTREHLGLSEDLLGGRVCL